MRRKVGRIHIVPWHLRDEACTQQASKRAEHQALIALVGYVIKKNGAQHIAGKRLNAPTLVPGRLARSRQTNREHHVSARRLRRDGDGSGGRLTDRFRLMLDNNLRVCSQFRSGFSRLQAVHFRSDISLRFRSNFRLYRLRIVGAQGCELVGRQFLPTLACGLRFVRATLGASSHEFFAHPVAHSLVCNTPLPFVAKYAHQSRYLEQAGGLSRS